MTKAHSVVFLFCILLTDITANGVWQRRCGHSPYPDAGRPASAGRDARPGEFPWQVGLSRSRHGQFFCGGVIINSHWVLTAAHCIEYISPSLHVYLTVGARAAAGWDVGAQTLLSEVILVHPRYRPATLRADIALVRTMKAIRWSPEVQPVCRPDFHDTFAGHSGIVSGWGSLWRGGVLPRVLQYVDVPILSNVLCNASGVGNIHTDNVCAGGIRELEKDACQGDSGGPLVTRSAVSGRWALVGLVSWGQGCADGFPGVYCRVTAYLRWLEATIASYDSGSGSAGATVAAQWEE